MTSVDESAVLALFSRPEGCTVRDYAEAVGITRQAASIRLRRFESLGLLTCSKTASAVSLASLAQPHGNPGTPTLVYRATVAASARDEAPVAEAVAEDASAYDPREDDE